MPVPQGLHEGPNKFSLKKIDKLKVLAEGTKLKAVC